MARFQIIRFLLFFLSNFDNNKCQFYICCLFLCVFQIHWMFGLLIFLAIKISHVLILTVLLFLTSWMFIQILLVHLHIQCLLFYCHTLFIHAILFVFDIIIVIQMTHLNKHFVNMCDHCFVVVESCVCHRFFIFLFSFPIMFFSLYLVNVMLLTFACSISTMSLFLFHCVFLIHIIWF